jgi:ABC-type dipeptide/oligopeptide/nickel transport system permease component
MKRIYLLLLVIILVVTNIISLIEVSKMSEIASYHLQDVDKAHQAMEAIMDRIHKDNPDYYWDVLMESDAYMQYEEIAR